MGQLQLNQMLPEDALKSNQYSIKYSLIAEDTFSAISTYSMYDVIYHQLGMYDSVMSVCDRSVSMLKKYNNPQLIASALGVKMFMMVERNDIKKAKPYIDYYEKHSGFYDSKTKSVKEGHEIYYYIKGLSYLYENRLDSAEYFFRKELCSTTDINDRQAASRGLYLLYKRRGVNDSITKYAEMWNAATDSAYANMSTRHLQQMKAMYDYSNSERIAEQKEAEAERYKYLAVSFVFAFALAVFIILYILQRRKKGIERIKKLNATNAMYIMLLKKKEKELEAALSDNVRNTALIDEKKSEIKQLEEKISALRGGDFNALRHDKALIYDAPIIDTMHELAGSSCKATVAEISCLRKHADDFLPDFMESLDIEKNNLGNLEVAVCILVKLQFITSEISCLLDISPQRLTNIRKRLNMKIFGEDGGAKEFDFRIRRTLPTD
ncbi:tetratricopeptide repeat protein [Prevotella sp. CAG:1058]|nr:tetratricopeptide repeat protein [Prevotella sp. CAG:1058]